MPATVSASGARLKVGFGNNGSVMNDPGQIGFRSFEGGEQYEHFAVGDPEEGYAIFYFDPSLADHTAHDVYPAGDLLNITVAGHTVFRNDAAEFVQQSRSTTNDGMLEIRNTLTFAADATRVTV